MPHPDLNHQASNWVLGNHDTWRLGSRFGPEFADAFNVLALTLPGAAVTYYVVDVC